MSWSIGYNTNWNRDVGYGVPAICDHPDCDAEIDRGLSYVCKDSEPYGGDGCGLYFCEKHLSAIFGCERCELEKPPFAPKPDTPQWTHHKMTDPSWSEWRKQQGIEEREWIDIRIEQPEVGQVVLFIVSDTCVSSGCYKGFVGESYLVRTSVLSTYDTSFWFWLPMDTLPPLQGSNDNI